MKNRFLQLIEDKQIAANAILKIKEKDKEGNEKEKEVKRQIDDFQVGDTVDVHVRILEGSKERTQVFSGVVISRRGGGVREAFTVRRIVQGEGVERIFPLQSPNVAKVEVKRTGKVRRAKLYYMRKLVGKATRLKERKVKANTLAPAAGKSETKAPESTPKK